VDNVHRKLVDVIHRLTGVHLEDDKLYLLDSRLGRIVKDNGLSGYDELADMLIRDPKSELATSVIDKITTHETRFFREESLFDALVMQIIPEMLHHKGVLTDTVGNPKSKLVRPGLNVVKSFDSHPMKIDIWSAACSTGQEPYSIAMMLQEKRPNVFPVVDILATDISKPVLDRAVKGQFTKFEVGRGLTDSFKHKYFDAAGEGQILKDNIRNSVRFEANNLIQDPVPGKFDIIFCRNVVIYFKDEVKKQIYHKLSRALKPDGVLVLGSSESLYGYMDNYIVREYGLTRYYEMKSSNAVFFGDRRRNKK